jgi:acyl-CoA thioester hydrolase
MPAVYSHPHVVTDDEIDGLGHVNNLHYLKWMQAAAVAHSSEQGWPPERYREIRSAWVVRTHHIDYLQPAFSGEEIVIQTWVSDFRKVTSLRKYKVTRLKDRVTLATGETNWAFLGLSPYVPRRIPPELASAFVLVPPADEPA